MLNTKNSVRSIWNECFHDSEEWKNFFFSEVYKDEDAQILINEGHAVASLMLLPYKFRYGTDILPVSYISGAATVKAFRHRGFMSELIESALKFSRERGDILASLIPASRELYFFYDRFDFSTVFFIKEERYTSSHEFRPEKEYITYINPGTEEIIDAFEILQNNGSTRILHDSGNMAHILKDIKLDGGITVAVKDKETGKTTAIGFAIPKESEVAVREILSENEDGAIAVLNEIKRHFPEKSLVIAKEPHDENKFLEARGMLRILNVEKLFKSLATQDNTISQVIRVTDRIIPTNNGIFRIENGRVEKLEEYDGKINLDVPVKTLAEVLFNSKSIGSLFNLPSVRPFMSLMFE